MVLPSHSRQPMLLLLLLLPRARSRMHKRSSGLHFMVFSCFTGERHFSFLTKHRLWRRYYNSELQKGIELSVEKCCYRASRSVLRLSLIHISEPTRRTPISY